MDREVLNASSLAERTKVRSVGRVGGTKESAECLHSAHRIEHVRRWRPPLLLLLPSPRDASYERKKCGRGHKHFSKPVIDPYRTLASNCGSASLLKEMVARDGIEPPTPAFSGRNSALAIYFNNKHIIHFSCNFNPSFWTHNGPKRDPQSGPETPTATRWCPPDSVRHGCSTKCILARVAGKPNLFRLEADNQSTESFSLTRFKRTACRRDATRS